MNKRLKTILQEDIQLAEPRAVRLRKSDDDEIKRRGGKVSPLLADLVHKGLAYERLENGAADPVVRQLLRELNDIVSHHIHESTAHFKDQLAQTNLFLAAFFASTFAELKFPVIENLTDAQRTGLFQTCLKPTDQMLDLLRAQYLLLLSQQANSQQAANSNQPPDESQ